MASGNDPFAQWAADAATLENLAGGMSALTGETPATSTLRTIAQRIRSAIADSQQQQQGTDAAQAGSDQGTGSPAPGSAEYAAQQLGRLEEMARLCEECRAAVKGGRPRYNTDMLRHAAERHGDQLAKLIAAVPTEGNA